MCPICGNKTRLKIREDTELKNFPLYCPKCRQENLVDIKQFKLTVITEPTQRRRADNLRLAFSFYRLFLFYVLLL
ncbi:cysteine-rich KTR domain-containing protein [Paracerasibacillus soli]